MEDSEFAPNKRKAGLLHCLLTELWIWLPSKGKLEESGVKQREIEGKREGIGEKREESGEKRRKAGGKAEESRRESGGKQEGKRSESGRESRGKADLAQMLIFVVPHCCFDVNFTQTRCARGGKHSKFPAFFPPSCLALILSTI